VKFTAFILAFVVLFLSVQPALAVLKEEQTAECAGGCCQHEEEIPAESGPNDDDCGNQCNPLLACSTCGGFLTNFLSFEITTIIEQSAKCASGSQRIYSQFSPDFWQPPKL
jgi:hypothetical protein